MQAACQAAAAPGLELLGAGCCALAHQPTLCFNTQLTHPNPLSLTPPCRGGYSFIANLLPIHCLACIVFNRVSSRLYIAYAPWVILGALAAGAHCAGMRGGMDGLGLV